MKIFLCAVAAVLFASACDRKDDVSVTTTSKPVEKITPPVTIEPAPAPTTTYVEIRTTYRDTMRDRLNRLDQKIAELEARTDAKAQETAQKLRVRRAELTVKLDRLGDQAEAGWNEFKKDVDSRFDELERDLDAAF